VDEGPNTVGVAFSVFTAAVALLMASAAPASGQADSASVALRAAEVLEEHCAEVAAGAATGSAQAVAAVSPVLAEVSEAHDLSGASYLLFWRGRLNYCLDREERARSDFEAFTTQVGDDPAFVTQVRQARALVRRILRTQRSSPRIHDRGLAVAAGGLFLTSGLFAGLSAWQWSVALDLQVDHDRGNRAWAETAVIAGQGQTAVDTQRVLLGAAIGCGAAGLVGLLSSMAPRRSPPPAVVGVAPGRRGVALVVGGRF